MKMFWNIFSEGNKALLRLPCYHTVNDVSACQTNENIEIICLIRLESIFANKNNSKGNFYTRASFPC